MRIRFTLKALRNLDDIEEFIARDSPENASRVITELLNVVTGIGEFPLAGREVPEYKNPRRRERINGSYRIIYLLKQDCAEIISVVHFAQLLEKYRK